LTDDRARTAARAVPKTTTARQDRSRRAVARKTANEISA
jgi:hypothetical protein